MAAIGPTRSIHCFFWAGSASEVVAPAAMRTGAARPVLKFVDSGMADNPAPCGLAVYSAADSLQGKQSGSASPYRSAKIVASPTLPRSQACLPVPRARSPSERRVHRQCSIRIIASYSAVVANAQQFCAATLAAYGSDPIASEAGAPVDVHATPLSSSPDSGADPSTSSGLNISHLRPSSTQEWIGRRLGSD